MYTQPGDLLSSDNLTWLRPTLGRLSPELAAFGVTVQIKAVIDSSELIAELKYQVEKRRDPTARSSFEELLDNETVLGCVPPLADEEVMKALPGLAAKSGLPVAEYHAAWGALRARLRVVEVDPATRTWAADLRDPTDAPFVALAEQEGAIIFSRDKDILEADAPAVRFVEVAVDLRDYARSKSVVLTVVVHGMQVSSLTARMLAAVGRGVVRMLTAFPQWTVMALALGGAAALSLSPHLRQRLLEAGRAVATALKGPAFRLASRVVEAGKAASRHEASLKAKLPVAPAPVRESGASHASAAAAAPGSVSPPPSVPSKTAASEPMMSTPDAVADRSRDRPRARMSAAPLTKRRKAAGPRTRSDTRPEPRTKAAAGKRPASKQDTAGRAPRATRVARPSKSTSTPHASRRSSPPATSKRTVRSSAAMGSRRQKAAGPAPRKAR